MSNYQSIAQSIGQSFGHNFQPPIINYNFAQPMQIVVDNAPNHDYQSIAKEFVDKYIKDNHGGVRNIGNYFDNKTLFTINLHRGNQRQMFDLIGSDSFINKLIDLGINTIKYYNTVCTAQPVGKKDTIITVHGRTDINGKHCDIIMTFVLHISKNQRAVITNHIFELFV